MDRVNKDASGILRPVVFRPRDRRPLYQQLAEGIAQQILDGAIRPGTKLPPQREAARQHGVALVTASQAYEILASQGLIESRTGRGTYVSADATSVATLERSVPSRLAAQPEAAMYRYAPQARRLAGVMQLLRAAIRPGTIAAAGGYTAPETYPIADLAQCYARTFLDDPPEIHQYRADFGDPQLRALFAQRLRSRGADVSADDILIVSGAQQALSLVAETLLDYGDTIAAEAPTYFSALEVFDQKRPSWVNLTVDAAGVAVDSFRGALWRLNPRLAYLNTAAHNPTGSYLARARLRPILESTRRSNLLIVEDQSCWPLSYDDEPPPPLLAADHDGRVVLIESLSKLLIPSLRIGYIAAKGAAAQALYPAKLRADSFTTTVAQRALLRFLESKAAARHLRAAKYLYRQRRDAVLERLKKALPDGATAIAPHGGVNLWVELPADWSAFELFNYSAQEGFLFMPGAPFYPAQPAANTLRISFGTLPEDAAAEAMSRFGRAVREYATAHRRRKAPPAAAIAAAV